MELRVSHAALRYVQRSGEPAELIQYNGMSEIYDLIEDPEIGITIPDTEIIFEPQIELQRKGKLHKFWGTKAWLQGEFDFDETTMHASIVVSFPRIYARAFASLREKEKIALVQTTVSRSQEISSN